METILALIGRKYVKNFSDRKFHLYKCDELKGIYNRKTYSKAKMIKDLARHPYSVGTCNCLDGIV